MGIMPTHTLPPMSIGPASEHIEYWYARFSKKSPVKDINLHKKYWCRVLNIGSIRMNILMLDTCNVEQTKDVRMYSEEFILVDIWILCCTKLKLN